MCQSADDYKQEVAQNGDVDISNSWATFSSHQTSTEKLCLHHLLRLGLQSYMYMHMCTHVPVQKLVFTIIELNSDPEQT